MSYYSFLDCGVLYVDALLCSALDCVTALHLTAVYLKELYRLSDCLEQPNSWPTSRFILQLNLTAVYFILMYFFAVHLTAVHLNALHISTLTLQNITFSHTTGKYSELVSLQYT